MNTSKIYLVGGAVRDYLLGKKPKDLDYLIDTSSYEEARDIITNLGCRIVQEKPEFKIFRAVHPKLGDLDFSLPRGEAGYDGRSPSIITSVSLEEDLVRRDFTINAMALPVNNKLEIEGNLIDLFGGKEDLEKRLIRFVGNPSDRITEDNLRVLRALRFSVTLDFDLSLRASVAIQEFIIGDIVSAERIFTELNKMFTYSNVKTINSLQSNNQLYLLDKVKLVAST